MKPFDYFIILAGMRTGSNLLEVNLNALAGVSCHGEAFNPSFVGGPKTDMLLGVDLATRENDPTALLEKIKQSDTLAGFRFFHDHDPRILDICLNDRRCAKIILSRNPVDSFVSWKIAQATGQWKLTNATKTKSQVVTFDGNAFRDHVDALGEFHSKLRHRLQTTGQAVFHLRYDDLRDVDVLNGLAAYLGTDARLSNVDKKLKKQNPEPLQDRVANYDEMRQALHEIDPFNLDHLPQFEPMRGPAIPTYVAAPQSALMYMPLRSGPDRAVMAWLAELDGMAVEELLTQFSQRTLRAWQSLHGPHRRFAVVRHPLARAHVAYCDRIVGQGAAQLPEIRANLRRVHDLRIPADGTDFTGRDGYDVAAHAQGFAGFLRFLRHNLAGQTSIRVDPSWASQNVLLQGMAQVAAPDAVLREDALATGLPHLAAQIGITDCPVWTGGAHKRQTWLREIYSPELERAARDAYAQDYRVFGFENWT
ncbi:sulfotransferase family 2 domain-containing protein [Yoonia sp.]|uniref:sulfotransferase family 2 domain-containing protein n=1 Tax=Yoonia sp. TaxID=2212373 RepID=UPI0023B74D7E